MNIAIVDDEQKERDILLDVIKEYALENRIEINTKVFASGEEILESYHPYAYTAVFMDIYMPGMTGVEAAQKLLPFSCRPCPRCRTRTAYTASTPLTGRSLCPCCHA